MVKPEVIPRRLDREDYLHILGKLSRCFHDEFWTIRNVMGVMSTFCNWPLRRFLTWRITLLPKKGLGPVNQYSDLPAPFGEQGWIDEALHEVWIDMIGGFRNILVHDYLDVNLK